LRTEYRCGRVHAGIHEPPGTADNRTHHKGKDTPPEHAGCLCGCLCCSVRSQDEWLLVSCWRCAITNSSFELTCETAVMLCDSMDAINRVYSGLSIVACGSVYRGILTGELAGCRGCRLIPGFPISCPLRTLPRYRFFPWPGTSRYRRSGTGRCHPPSAPGR